MVATEPPARPGPSHGRPSPPLPHGRDSADRARQATDLSALVGEVVQLRKVGTSWKGLCPFHEDRNPSLSVDQAKGLYHCHGCGASGDAITWAQAIQHLDFREAVSWLLRRAGLPEAEPAPRPKPARRGLGRVAATYDYVGADGEVIYQVVRLDPKDFRQRRPDGRGGWVWGLGDTARVLYRLPEVLVAVREGKRIWVTEGEKDADALRAAGEVATTAAQGASSPWLESYTEPLQGAKAVRVVADADPPGWARAKAVRDALEAAGVPVAVLRAAEGKDAADHLEAGRGVDDFVEVAAAELDELAGPTPAPHGQVRELRAIRGERDDVRASARGFWATPAGLWRSSVDKEGNPTEVQLTTADIEVLGTIARDWGDGERSVTWRLAVRCDGREAQLEIDADTLDQPVKVLHRSGLPGATVISRQGPWVVEAIHSLGASAPVSTVYPHLGWREVDGRWLYLHGKGAIGPDGPIEGVEVEPPVKGYGLTAPLEGQDLAEAVAASVSSLEACEAVMVPLLGAVWRSALPVLPPTSLHLTGKTGIGKTALVAVALSHFGADAQPVGWLSTANSVEGAAWGVAGHVLALDDYVAADERQRGQLESMAERVLRSAANHLGRARMRPDGTLRPTREPRALIVSTGEDTPGGNSQSQRARVLVVELKAEEAPCAPGAEPARTAALTAAQLAGRSGLLSSLTASYVTWLAGRVAEMGMAQARAGIEAAEREQASQWREATVHARTAPAVASLQVGWDMFLGWATEVGALSTEDAEAVQALVADYLRRLVDAQAQHLSEADPVQIWVRIVQAALRSGHCHVAPRDDDVTTLDDAWGWQDGRTEGDRVGWLDDDGVYLVPDAIHRVVARYARDMGQSWTWSARATWERLLDRGLIRRGDARHPFTPRINVAGRREYVVHMLPGVLSEDAGPEDPI